MVFAHTNGYNIIGAEFPTRLARSACLSVAQEWTRTLAPGNTLASLVGEGINGERLCTAPLASDTLTPSCTSTKERLALLEGGTHLAWCSLKALEGTALSEWAARAILAMQAFIRPIKMAAFQEAYNHNIFRAGAAPTQPLQARSEAPLLNAMESEQAIEATRNHDNILISAIDKQRKLRRPTRRMGRSSNSNKKQKKSQTHFAPTYPAIVIQYLSTYPWPKSQSH